MNLSQLPLYPAIPIQQFFSNIDKSFSTVSGVSLFISLFILKTSMIPHFLG